MWVIKSIIKPKFSQCIHEGVHMKEFAAYDQLQTWQASWQQRIIFDSASANYNIILNKYEEVKRIIPAKTNTVAAAKWRKDSWQKNIMFCDTVCQYTALFDREEI